MLLNQKWNSYYRLIRLHQTTGIWLLLWPSLWGIFFVSKEIIPMKLIIIFILGSIMARGAGCIINDIIDRNIDKFVERTKNRPLASGEISIKEALIILIILLICCLILLLQLPPLSLLLSLASLIPIVIYPFMKRITHWPQLFLGFTFNLSSLIGIASVLNHLPPVSFFLYVSCIFWTLGYDTIYGHQDKKDDLVIGVKSTAIFLDKYTKLWLTIFYSNFIIFLSITAHYFQLHYSFYLTLIPIILHLLWQIITLDINNPLNCYQKFVSNKYLGWLVATSIIISKVLLSKS